MNPSVEITEAPSGKVPLPDKKRLKKMFSWTDDGL